MEKKEMNVSVFDFQSKETIEKREKKRRTCSHILFFNIFSLIEFKDTKMDVNSLTLTSIGSQSARKSEILSQRASSTKLPRIILKNAMGFELKTSTSYQNAIYRAKTRLLEPNRRLTEAEWRWDIDKTHVCTDCSMNLFQFATRASSISARLFAFVGLRWFSFVEKTKQTLRSTQSWTLGHVVLGLSMRKISCFERFVSVYIFRIIFYLTWDSIDQRLFKEKIFLFTFDGRSVFLPGSI